MLELPRSLSVYILIAPIGSNVKGRKNLSTMLFSLYTITHSLSTSISIGSYPFISYRFLSVEHELGYGRFSLSFNRYGPESGKWKDLNVLRSLPRFRSVQFSIFNIFRELIYPIYYRALYGDTTFRYTTGWATNNACRCMAAGNYKRNICLWVLLLRREFVSQATH